MYAYIRLHVLQWFIYFNMSIHPFIPWHYGRRTGAWRWRDDGSDTRWLSRTSYAPPGPSGGSWPCSTPESVNECMYIQTDECMYVHTDRRVYVCTYRQSIQAHMFQLGSSNIVSQSLKGMCPFRTHICSRCLYTYIYIYTDHVTPCIDDTYVYTYISSYLHSKDAPCTLARLLLDQHDLTKGALANHLTRIHTRPTYHWHVGVSHTTAIMDVCITTNTMNMWITYHTYGQHDLTKGSLTNHLARIHIQWPSSTYGQAVG